MAVRPLRPVVTRQGVTVQRSWAAIVSALHAVLGLAAAAYAGLTDNWALLAVAGVVTICSVTWAVLALSDKDFT